MVAIICLIAVMSLLILGVALVPLAVRVLTREPPSSPSISIMHGNQTCRSSASHF